MLQELNKQTVLIVDDDPINIKILINILKEDYDIKFAKSGETALILVKKFVPDIILLDVMMPEMDGYQVCAKIKENPLTKNIPVIFITAKNQEADETKGFELGAVDYISKPISPVIVKARVGTHLALYDQKRELEKEVRERTKEIYDTRMEIIRRLSIASEHKDIDTGLHIVRMSKYCYIIAKEYGFGDYEAQTLMNAAPMHDIGKIGIPDHILLKNGKLDPDEWNIMITHSEIGAKIIGKHDSDLLRTAYIVALQHHEKYDGSGYPMGLRGNDIDINARITIIADVFDALTSERPYKKAWDVDKAIDTVNEEARYYDPKILKAFNNSIPRILEVKEKYSSSLESQIPIKIEPGKSDLYPEELLREKVQGFTF